MEKLVAFAIALSSYSMLAMDSQEAPIIVLPSRSHESTPRASFEITPRRSFDDSDWDSSRECSPRPMPIPKKLTSEECVEYLNSLNMRNKELYSALVLSKALNEHLDNSFGLCLYLSGLADQKDAPFIGTTQYFLTDTFKRAIKGYFAKIINKIIS